jgi:putative ABC transport system permease protein
MTQAQGNGGVPARRAVVRWALRMFRREWRQQVLVLALITLAVAGAIVGASAAYSAAPTDDGQFGTADRRILLRVDAPATLASDIEALRAWTGAIDVIAHRHASVPGSVEPIDVRAQSLHGTYTTPTLALRAGRYPSGPGEVALTQRTATLLNTEVGSSVALDRRQRTVVGLVENPGDLGDQFALAAPAYADPPDSVTILAKARAGLQAPPTNMEERFRAERRGGSEKTSGAVLVLALSTVVLLLIGLVAAAGFVVLAQRRLRQLGMLAAVGATGRHLRLVVVANGAVVGVAAALVGAAIAVPGWVALAPRLEAPAGHRIAPFDVPWWLVASGMVLAVVTATAAAWWPARAMARIPVTQALSGRPPRPKPAHRSALAAAVLLAIGFACLAVGIDSARDRANLAFVAAGVITLVVGVLLASPLAIRLLATTARRLPVAARLALRDLARHQARSSAALAAISLALGIAVAVVIVATAAVPTADQGNLSDRQVMVRIGGSVEQPVVPDHLPAEVDAMRADVDRFATTLDRPAVTAITTVVDPSVSETSHGLVVRMAATLARRVDAHTFRAVDVLSVATPELLRRLGTDAQSIRPDTEILTAASGDLRIVDAGPRGGKDVIPKTQRLVLSPYRSMPRVLITPAAVARHGWAPAAAGWLVESKTPLTDAQLAAGRAMAAQGGLTLESRKGGEGLTALRTGATTAGMLLALGVLAMTVGLIRSEAAGDLRTLAATGATTTTRRALTATTAGALALLGSVLGVGGAYLALVAGYLDDLSPLGQVPVPELLATVIGVPITALVAGWLLAGREPPAMARAALD